MKIYKTNDNGKEIFTYKIYYYDNKNKKTKFNSNKIDELKNKLLISSIKKNNTTFNNQGIKEIDKREMTKKFVDLIENIQRLSQIINRLFEAGYPFIDNLKLRIKDSEAFEVKNPNNNLKIIMESYHNIIKDYNNMISEGYQKYPLLRLFYGKNFYQLFLKVIHQNVNIYHLLSSVSLNKIIHDIDFVYDKNKNFIENINDYLTILFNKNNINLEDIYQQNEISRDLEVTPGLYSIEKNFSKNELNVNILNLFLNLTGKAPITNTLLFCNEETNIEEIKSFFFRSIFCENKTLFVISNLELLQLSIKQSAINLLDSIYGFKKGKIKSILIFLYESEDSGLKKKYRN